MVLSMELGSYHSPGSKNFEVAPTFIRKFVNFWSSGHSKETFMADPINPSACGYLKPSQHCDVGRFLDFDET